MGHENNPWPYNDPEGPLGQVYGAAIGCMIICSAVIAMAIIGVIVVLIMR